MEAAAYETFARNERDHFWFVGRRAIFFDQLRRHLGPAGDDAVVLDLGCGVGGMLAPLAEFGAVHGMDIDPGSLRFCRDRGFPHVFRGFGDHLPIADASVDLIAAFDVLEHIPEERETIAECFRALKPGGWFFLSGPAYQFLYTHQDRVVHHQRRYTTGDLKRKFRAAGFEIHKASYINFFLFPLILAVLAVKKVQEKLKPPRDEDTRFNTDVTMPRWLNAVFTWIFSAERHVLRRISVPTGHSVILLARKPEASGR